jgi:hypothetical protein
VLTDNEADLPPTLREFERICFDDNPAGHEKLEQQLTVAAHAALGLPPPSDS